MIRDQWQSKCRSKTFKRCPVPARRDRLITHCSLSAAPIPHTPQRSKHSKRCAAPRLIKAKPSHCSLLIERSAAAPLPTLKWAGQNQREGECVMDCMYVKNDGCRSFASPVALTLPLQITHRRQVEIHPPSTAESHRANTSGDCRALAVEAVRSD